jgi:hypothetical protein
MKTFAPHVRILPPAQRRLWAELAQVPKGFVLYGGTAVGLWLGPRPSEDFDFGDGDLPGLSEEVKDLLGRAAAAVREIPETPRRSDDIAPEP